MRYMGGGGDLLASPPRRIHKPSVVDPFPLAKTESAHFLFPPPQANSFQKPSIKLQCPIPAAPLSNKVNRPRSSPLPRGLKYRAQHGFYQAEPLLPVEEDGEAEEDRDGSRSQAVSRPASSMPGMLHAQRCKLYLSPMLLGTL